jgi:hypothetical protein
LLITGLNKKNVSRDACQKMKRPSEEEAHIVWPLEILLLILQQLYTRLVDRDAFQSLCRTRSVSRQVRQMIDQRVIPAVRYVGPEAFDFAWEFYPVETLLRLTGLHSVELGRCREDILGRLRPCFSSLRSLTTTDSASLDGALAVATNLTTLSISHAYWFDSYVLQPMTGLRNLRLKGPHFTPRPEHCTTLVKLKISHSSISGLARDTDFNRMTNLQVLSLSEPHRPRLHRLTSLRKLDASVLEDRDLLHLSRLTRLRLGREGVVRNDVLSQLTQLRHLNLSQGPNFYTPVLACLTNLNTLILHDRQCNNVEYLKEKIPHCCIKYSVL